LILNLTFVCLLTHCDIG